LILQALGLVLRPDEFLSLKISVRVCPDETMVLIIQLHLTKSVDALYCVSAFI